MEDLRFSPATGADLGALQRLLGQCELPAEDLTPAHLAGFILGREDDRLVGSVGLEPLGGDVALLRSLAVAPDRRGRGLGRALWERAQELARARGFARLYLLTTTAEALFAAWGFRRLQREQAPRAVQTTSQFSAMCPTSAAVMVLDLGAAAPPPAI